MKKNLHAQRLARVPEYIFSQLARSVIDVEAQSKCQVLNFGMGTPDIPPSRLYINKLSQFINDNDAHMYPPYGATLEFAQALINWHQQRFAVTLEKDELLPLLGAKDGVSHLPLALLNEGDEILVPNPGYPAFSGPATMIGAVPIFYNLREENNFRIDLVELEQKITARTKCIWVNFPANPTGQVATLAELEKIINLARRHKLLVIYDNAYSEITFDGFVAPSILEVSGAKEVTVEIGSFSKSFSLAGFRMGWIVGNKEIIAALAKVKSQMDSGLSLPLQRLGAFALNNIDHKWQTEMIATYAQRRNLIADFIKPLGLTFSLPKGGLYIWAKIPDSARDAETFCLQLLQEKQILFTPGNAFGDSGKRFVRVSICGTGPKNLERDL